MSEWPGDGWSEAVVVEECEASRRRRVVLECHRVRLGAQVEAEPETEREAVDLGGSLHGSLLDVPVVLAELSGLVDRLEASGLPLDGSVLVGLRALVGRLDAVICTGEIEFDQVEGYRELGATSLRSFMADAYGVSRREATRLARRAERLESWPEVAAAWRAGRSSGAQVEVMVTGVPARFVRLFGEHASGVIAAVESLDPDSTALAVRQWVAMAEAADGPEQFTERPSGLFIESLLDGSQSISGHLTQAGGAIVRAAIHDFSTPDPVDERGRVLGEPRTAAQRAADALVAACEFAVRLLPQVSVIVDVAELRAVALAEAGVRDAAALDAFAEAHGCTVAERSLYATALDRRGVAVTHEGQVLDAPAVAHLTCDSVIHRMMVEGSEVLEMGRRVRSTTPRQRRALVARDRHCRAPGCRTGPVHCDAHHLVHWGAGGTTDLDNLVLLCGSHHRMFHDHGYSLAFDPASAEFTVTFPSGSSRSTLPDRPERVYFDRSLHPVMEAIGQSKERGGSGPGESPQQCRLHRSGDEAAIGVPETRHPGDHATVTARTVRLDTDPPAARW
jgi:hypothetical protein